MLPANPLLNAIAPAGPHLPVALLRQYAAGTLASAAQHRVEAHTLACPRCADILTGLLQTPAATTDQALAQLQQRLRHRAQPPQPAARPMLRQRRWLVPQLAAAAALLLGLVAGGWWAWQQRHAASQPPLAAVAPAPAPPAPPPAAAPARPPGQPAPAAKPLATAPVTRRPRPGRLPQLARPALPAATEPATGQLAMATPPAAAPARPLAAPAQLPAPLAAASSADQAAPLARADSVRPAGRVAMAKAASSETVRERARMPSAPPVAPTPMGGLAALHEQLRRKAAKFVPTDNTVLAGAVKLRLTIGATGKLEKVTVLQSLRTDYDEEAQRLLREGPTWMPGIEDGKRVAQDVTLFVLF